MPTVKPMRLFIGLPIPSETADTLAALAAQLRPSFADTLRWSAREGWHITLRFLGKTTLQQYGCVVAALHTLHRAPVSIQPEGLATFARPGVLLVTVRLTPELAALQQAVVAATTPCGFTPESRPYRPHITLARARGRQNIEQVPLQTEMSPVPGFLAKEILLYESQPGPGGSQYEIRERFLRASP